jgi:putative Mg2+ transporter-C (MgtC) family protein
MDILEVILKLFLAVALGGMVGLERESSQKPAGFRTNILICVGSASLMILAGMILRESPASGGELTRIAAGAVTGMGFIGAGTIIQSRGSVLGLTTAATLWTVSALGLMIGAGYYLIALVMTAVIIATLIIFRQVESQFLKRSHYRYEIRTATSRDLLVHIKKVALHEGIKFQTLHLHHEGDEARILLSFTAPDDKEERFNQAVLGREDIIEIKID